MRLSLKTKTVTKVRFRSFDGQAHMITPLDLAAEGSSYEVCSLPDSCVCRQLEELGLCPGAKLRVLQNGSPCLLQVGSSKLSLRGEFCQQILVQPLAE